MASGRPGLRSNMSSSRPTIEASYSDASVGTVRTVYSDDSLVMKGLLKPRGNSTQTEFPDASHREPDQGKLAWLVLAGCSLLQAPVWGFSVGFGVLQQYYTELGLDDTELTGDISQLTVVGTTATGLLYLSMPLTFFLLTRYPFLRHFSAPVGLILSIAAYLASAFSNRVWQLILTQGIMGALGGGLIFAPTSLLVDEWFVRKKGLALALMWVGKDVTGIVLPFFFGQSLRAWGSKVTMLAWTGFVAAITTPILFFLIPRVPITKSTAVHRMDVTFLKRPSFWILQAGNVFQSLGFYLPQAYLPTFAVDYAVVTPTIGILILVALNAASVPGGILCGLLCDRIYVNAVVMMIAVGSSTAVFVFWGFGVKISMLVIFSILYGLTAGAFSSTWGGAIKQVKIQCPTANSGLIFGLLAGGRGIGFILSGPLAVALLDAKGATSWDEFGYGTPYGYMIIFAGLSAVFGGIGWFSRDLWKWKY